METGQNSSAHHISKQFNQELEELRNLVLRMGGMVERQLTDALEAITQSDAELAQKVISGDQPINSLEVDIDEHSVLVLARRQPAASDLRLVIAVLKASTDLERIGDEAQKIARLGLKLAESKYRDFRYTPLTTLGRHTAESVRHVLDAFARLDAEEGLRVIREEEAVDREYESLMRQIITYMLEDPRTISPALEAAWAARALERISDHARNIAEHIIYLAKGKDIRHASVEQAERSVHPEPPAKSS